MRAKRSTTLASLAIVALLLLLAAPSYAQQLETLVLEGDEIPGTDQRLEVILQVFAAEDGIGITGGVDDVLRVDPTIDLFTGVAMTPEDGLWALKRNRELVPVALVDEVLAAGHVVSVANIPSTQPSLFDSRGRVLVSSGGNRLVFRTQPGEPADFELDVSDLLIQFRDANRRLVTLRAATSYFAQGRIGDETVTCCVFNAASNGNPAETVAYLGDPLGSGQTLLDRNQPFAPGVSFLPRTIDLLLTNEHESIAVARSDSRETAIGVLDSSLRTRLLVQTGDPLPGSTTGESFAELKEVTQGERNRFVFVDRALWRSDFDGNLQALVRNGDPAPGTASTFAHAGSGFREWLVDTNSRGQTAFRAYRTGSAFDEGAAGIWLAQDHGGIELRVLRGQQQGDIQVGTFWRARRHELLEDGSVFFSSLASSDLPGATEGILRADSEGVLHKVAIIGETLEVRAGDERVIESVFGAGEFDGGYVVQISFSDGSKGIFRASVPERKRFCGWRWSKRGGKGWERVRKECDRPKHKRRRRSR